MTSIGAEARLLLLLMMMVVVVVMVMTRSTFSAQVISSLVAILLLQEDLSTRFSVLPPSLTGGPDNLQLVLGHPGIDPVTSHHHVSLSCQKLVVCSKGDEPAGLADSVQRGNEVAGILQHELCRSHREAQLPQIPARVEQLSGPRGSRAGGTGARAEVSHLMISELLVSEASHWLESKEP